MYKINFNHLYYFLTIAKEGSIVKASKKLHITQPALSHQLRLLEQDLGKKLFDRVGRKLVINQQGEKVKEYANKIFRQSEEMLESIKKDLKQNIKIFKIGVLPWVSQDFIYQFTRQLLFNPYVKIQFFHNDLEVLTKELVNNKIDLILSDSPYSGKSKKVISHFLKKEPIVCVTASKNVYKGKFPDCLQGKKVLRYLESCQMGDAIEHFLKNNEISIQTVGEFTDTSLLKHCLLNGVLAGFLPESSVKRNLRNKSLHKLGSLKSSHLCLWAITQKNYPENGVITALLKRYIK